MKLLKLSGICLLLIAWLSSPFVVLAQQNTTDSLELLILKSNADTTKVKLMTELAYQLYSQSTEKALDYANQALDLAQKNDYEAGQATSYNVIGICNAIEGNYDMALKNFHAALEIFEKLGDERSIAKTYNSLGNVNRIIENNEKALENYLKSLEIKERIGTPEDIASTLNNLGVLYITRGEYDLAVEQYKRSLQIYHEAGNVPLMAKLTNNIGIAYFEKGNLDKAAEYYQRSVELSRSINDFTGVARALNNLGVVLEKQKKLGQALETYTEALQVSKQVGDSYAVGNLHLNIGSIYIQLELYNKAKDYLDSALTASRNLGIQNLEMKVLERFYTYYNAQQNSQQALYYYIRYSELKDSLFNEEKSRQLTEIQTKYQTQQQQQQIAMQKLELNKLDAEAQKRNAFMLALLAAFLLILVSAFVLFRNNRQKRKTNKLLKTKNEAIEHKNSILQQQQEEIIVQTEQLQHANEELELHRNHLTELVNERTADLKVAKQKAEEANKLKTAFLENLSHEIRTPMNAIVGFSNLLQSGDITHQEHEEYIKLVVKNTQILLQFIENITDVSKLEAGIISFNITEFNLNKLMRELEKTFLVLKKELQKDAIELRLNLTKPDQSFVIRNDYQRLQQILMVLIENALKFTEKGTVEFGYHEIGENIVLFVKDTGIGISDESQKIIFERFRKLTGREKLYGGAGIGLFISKKLAEMMQGQINVESKLGEGSTFFLKIPKKIYP